MVNRAMCQWFGEFHHVTVRNADGTPARCRANGKCKTWKRQPNRFRLPVKHGMRTCFYLTPHNAHQWVPQLVWRRCEEYGLDPVTTPLLFLCDRIEEDTSDPRNGLTAKYWRLLAADITPSADEIADDARLDVGHATPHWI